MHKDFPKKFQRFISLLNVSVQKFFFRRFQFEETKEFSCELILCSIHFGKRGLNYPMECHKCLLNSITLLFVRCKKS